MYTYCLRHARLTTPDCVSASIFFRRWLLSTTSYYASSTDHNASSSSTTPNSKTNIDHQSLSSYSSRTPNSKSNIGHHILSSSSTTPNSKTTTTTSSNILASSSSPHSSSSSPHTFAPSPSETSYLSRQFPRPKSLIRNFLAPISIVDPSVLPIRTLTPKYGSKCWSCRLSFSWPMSFVASAVAEDQDKAEIHAFLVACKTLAKLGLVIPAEEPNSAKRLKKLESWRKNFPRQCNELNSSVRDSTFLHRRDRDNGLNEENAINGEKVEEKSCHDENDTDDDNEGKPSHDNDDDNIVDGDFDNYDMINAFTSQEKRYKRAITQDLYRTAWCWGKKFHVVIKTSFGSPQTDTLSSSSSSSIGASTSSPTNSTSISREASLLPPLLPGIWRCQVSFDWPIPVRASSSGLTSDDAERNAFLLACLRLRMRNIFDKSLSVPPSVMEKLIQDKNRGVGGGEAAADAGGEESAARSKIRKQKRRPGSEEVLLWTDAGAKGYGGFYRPSHLAHNSVGTYNDSIRGHQERKQQQQQHDAQYSNSSTDTQAFPRNCRTWFCQPWPDFIERSFLHDATPFLECYAAVSAIYTWRKTFRGRKVTLMTDCEAANNFVNKGIPNWVYLDENHGQRSGRAKDDLSKIRNFCAKMGQRVTPSSRRTAEMGERVTPSIRGYSDIGERVSNSLYFDEECYKHDRNGSSNSDMNNNNNHHINNINSNDSHINTSSNMCFSSNNSSSSIDDNDDELRLQSAFYLAHLNSLLIKTKYEMDLDIQAIAIPRLENVCADALAGLDAEAFRRHAVDHPKSDEPTKVKQLLFLPAFRLFPLFSPAF